jgi:glycerate-2-kinase
VRDAVAEGLAGRRRGPPGKADVDWHRHAAVLLTGNAEAVAAAAAELDRLGFPPAEGRPTVTGPVEAAAEDLVAAVRAAARVGPASVAWGGETTLVVRGPGRGGRNQHLAALAARRLASLAAGAPAGALGPARLDECAAGGDVEILVDAGTWHRASAAGVDPDRALAELDSHALLAGSGDLVVTGPTGTNVMDLYLAVAAPVAEGA